MLKKQPHSHHAAEHKSLPAPLREKVARPDQLAVLDAMHGEHTRLAFDRVPSWPAKENSSMASPHTMQRNGQANWTLMTAIHDALRRDLDQLIHPAVMPTAACARWMVFREQLHLHLAAEHTAMWRPARAKVTGDPHGQALLDAMEDEQQLIGPLQAMADDAFAMGADPGWRRQLLTRLRTRLTSHLAHEEADALPLIGQIMSPHELSAITKAIRGGAAERTIPWALAHASPQVRTQVLAQLPAPARLVYRRVWLPRFTRNTRRCEHRQTAAAPPGGSTSRRPAKESSASPDSAAS